MNCQNPDGCLNPANKGPFCKICFTNLSYSDRKQLKELGLEGYKSFCKDRSLRLEETYRRLDKLLSPLRAIGVEPMDILKGV
jgi:hypothetical protein